MKKMLFVIWFLLITLMSAQEKTKGESALPGSMEKRITAQESDIWYVLQNRRSVRKFRADTIPNNDILKILDAARMAPTSGNQQPWKFLVVRDKDKINQMKEACMRRVMERYDKNEKKAGTREQHEKQVRSVFENYCSAPVYIIILTDNNSVYPDYNHWDGPLAAENLMLAARALGYGTVFITDAIPEEVTKEVLNIPDTYTRVCITPLGVPIEWPKSPEKKKLEDFILFEKF
jgi:nitroreductase